MKDLCPKKSLFNFHWHLVETAASILPKPFLPSKRKAPKFHLLCRQNHNAVLRKSDSGAAASARPAPKKRDASQEYQRHLSGGIVFLVL